MILRADTLAFCNNFAKPSSAAGATPFSPAFAFFCGIILPFSSFVHIIRFFQAGLLCTGFFVAYFYCIGILTVSTDNAKTSTISTSDRDLSYNPFKFVSINSGP